MAKYVKLPVCLYLSVFIVIKYLLTITWFDHPQASPHERLRLVAKQYKANQCTTIIKAKQLKLAAEEKVAAQELYETTMLLEAAKCGDNFTSLDPNMMINVA